jgi:quaternary ammonium compound-resistance protein SugE
MSWVYLIIAGIFETVWAVALKQAEGFSRLWPTGITVAAMAISLYFLSLALKTLPLGTAYAVWTGIGAVGAAVLGMFLFGESHAPMRIVSILLVVAGIAGLRFTAS